MLSALPARKSQLVARGVGSGGGRLRGRWRGVSWGNNRRDQASPISPWAGVILFALPASGVLPATGRDSASACGGRAPAAAGGVVLCVGRRGRPAVELKRSAASLMCASAMACGALMA